MNQEISHLYVMWKSGHFIQWNSFGRAETADDGRLRPIHVVKGRSDINSCIVDGITLCIINESLLIITMRHYATSRNVAGSIPDEVIGFFNWPNPSSRFMALGSTQPLQQWVPEIFLGIKGGRRVRLKPHRHLWTDFLENVGASTFHSPMGFHGLLQG
jgi:hypothetical protein